MNRKIETQKIKVNSIAEMLAEMRKLKNLGGEWKVLEKYIKQTLGGENKKTKDALSGFILSNGKRKVDIVFEKYDYELTRMNPIFGGKEHYQKLGEIFPENEVPFSNRRGSRVGCTSSSKIIGEIDKRHTTIMRVFNAWNFNDLRKILADYYVANKAEIDQFSKNNFSHGVDDFPAVSAQWLEVGEDDQLFYIWVGKRDPKKGSYLGGGEWEICLKKSDLVGRYSKSLGKLKDFADSEEAKDLKACLNTHWAVLTDAGDSNRGNKGLIEDYENYQVGFDPDYYDQNGNPAFPSKGKPKNSQKPEPVSGQNLNPPQPSNLSKSAKEQVRHYMEQNGIFQLTLDNGKLVVEYNNFSKKEEKEINSQQLRTIRDYLKGHNNIVNLEQLKSSSNSPTTNPDKKSDYTFWIVGGIGLVLVAGIFVYWIRKRKNK